MLYNRGVVGSVHRHSDFLRRCAHLETRARFLGTVDTYLRSRVDLYYVCAEIRRAPGKVKRSSLDGPFSSARFGGWGKAAGSDTG